LLNALLCPVGLLKKSHWLAKTKHRGLKPASFCSVYGTTKVVPVTNAAGSAFFRKLL
jgi:hypothetical protein